MPKAQFSTTRKRQRSEQRLPLNETAEPFQKKPRLSHSNKSPSPAAFWDNLSIIWLTKDALKELDRRNTQATSSFSRSSHRQSRRPVTQNFHKKSQTSSNAADYLRCCEPRVLKNIKLFARHGGPDLKDLRNYPEPTHSFHHTMSSSQSSLQGRRKRASASTSNTKATTNTPKTQTTGVYNRNFEQHLIDHNIYPNGYEYPDGSVSVEPNGWEEINQRLAQPRPSLSPSQFTGEDFQKFRRENDRARKEKQVSELVVPIMEGKNTDSNCRSGGIPFTNLDPLTDGTLKPDNPDIYYGARPEQLDRQVRNELSGHIVPSTQHDLPMAPNFFMAVKGPGGTVAVAKLQACYNGAVGARGMHSLQSYGSDEAAYGNAYTISSTYYDGTLNMYTSHLTEPSSLGGRPEYHMTQLNSYGLTGNPQTFQQGVAAYRNARVWAKEQRDEAIKRANEQARATAPAADISFGPVSSFASEASAGASYTIEPPNQLSQTTLTESQTSGDLRAFNASAEEAVSDDEHSRKGHKKRPQ